jgi:hypothetical protein
MPMAMRLGLLDYLHDDDDLDPGRFIERVQWESFAQSVNY